MASLYKQGSTYYLNIQYKSKRVRQSLGTSDLNQARKIANQLEPKLFMQLITGESSRSNHNLSLPILINHFLAYDHGWRPNTLMINRNSLNHYLKKGFPANKSYRAMVIRCLNRCYKWGHEEGLIDKPKHFKGGNDFEARTRAFNADELSLILSDIQPYQVSKLLGHASVTTTERHYAPLLATDVEEFVL